MSNKAWEHHYHRQRSELAYPDENLVRMLKKEIPLLKNVPAINAADIGCGSGRHLHLLEDLGFRNVIGMDISMQGLRLCKKNRFHRLIQCDNRSIPVKGGAFDVIVAWGSLHYAMKEDMPVMLGEIHRILKKGGILFATLRSSRDTYLKKGKHLGNNTWITNLDDITGSVVSFYDEKEITPSFTSFGSCQYGIIERSLMGDLSKKLSHWVIKAVR